jgi:hypothetical protein
VRGLRPRPYPWLLTTGLSGLKADIVPQDASPAVHSQTHLLRWAPQVENRGGNQVEIRQPVRQYQYLLSAPASPTSECHWLSERGPSNHRGRRCRRAEPVQRGSNTCRLVSRFTLAPFAIRANSIGRYLFAHSASGTLGKLTGRWPENLMPQLYGNRQLKSCTISVAG